MKDRSAQKYVTRSLFADMVAEELSRARRGHAPLNSAHEGYAVILEELDEFWDWCRLKREQRLPESGLMELLQVAAMAQRLAEDLGMVPTAREEV